VRQLTEALIRRLRLGEECLGLKGQVEEKMQDRKEKLLHKHGAKLLCRNKNKEKKIK
jgi:hypothetical protein